jgi:hypothetical protein
MYAKWSAIRQARAEGGGVHTSIRLSLVKLSRHGRHACPDDGREGGEEKPAESDALDLYSPREHHVRRAGRMFELIRRSDRVEYV